MIPPRGFKAELYPLHHKVYYSFGLSGSATGQNTCYATLVKNYKTLNPTRQIVVNPHNTNYVEDAGAVCAKMSIIDRLSLSLQFDYTKDSGADSLPALKFTWFPIFFSFPEKLDAADDNTTTTVKSILELTKDATQEDITPLWSTTKLDITPPSSKSHPVSSVNLTEVFGLMNLTTNTNMEGVALDYDLLMNALRRYTNKGALKACMGRIRHEMVSDDHSHISRFIKKFVPRSIRRIQPYSFFAIVVHLPMPVEFKQSFMTSVPTAGSSALGVKIMANYHEWNPDHYQEMVGDGPA